MSSAASHSELESRVQTLEFDHGTLAAEVASLKERLTDLEKTDEQASAA
jgi:hypothetical protein